MSWGDLARDAGLETTDHAAPADIAAAERALGCALPASLRGLLEETDGLSDEYGADVVFGAEDLARRNHEMRTADAFPELYMPFDCLLFFGEAGNGDLFGFPILSRGVEDLHVFAWDHETDSRTAVASGLARFVSGDQWSR